MSGLRRDLHAIEIADRRRLRMPAWPRPAKPRSIITQVDGSGAAVSDTPSNNENGGEPLAPGLLSAVQEARVEATHSVVDKCQEIRVRPLAFIGEGHRLGHPARKPVAGEVNRRSRSNRLPTQGHDPLVRGIAAIKVLLRGGVVEGEGILVADRKAADGLAERRRLEGRVDALEVISRRTSIGRTAPQRQRGWAVRVPVLGGRPTPAFVVVKLLALPKMNA
jgi:hypothetical protein